MHLQRRRVHQKAGTDELLVLVMLPEDVTHILTEETLDALAKLLDPIDVLLSHAPGTIRGIGRPGSERLDLLLDPVVPRNVGHQVLEMRETAHRLDGDRLVGGKVAHPGHAHELRHSVHVRRARAALAGFAVPAHGEIAGLLGLHLMNGIENHHSFGNFGGIVLEAAGAILAPPDAKGRGGHQPISLMTALSSSGMSRSFSRTTCISPPGPFRTTMLNLADSGSLFGKSSLKWPPRLSFRVSAERVIASETVRRFSRSSAVCHPGLYSRFPATPTCAARAFSRSRPSCAFSMSFSFRTIPTRSCIMSCSSCCTW